MEHISCFRVTGGWKSTNFADNTPNTASHSTRDLIAELMHGINILDEVPVARGNEDGSQVGLMAQTLTTPDSLGHVSQHVP